MPVTWRPQKKTETPNKNAVLGRSFKPTGLDRSQKYSKTPLKNAYLELFFVKIKIIILLLLRSPFFVNLSSLRSGWIGLVWFWFGLALVGLGSRNSRSIDSSSRSSRNSGSKSSRSSRSI